MDNICAILISWLLAILAWSPVGLWIVQKLKAGFNTRPVHTFILGTLVGAAVNAMVLGLLSFWIPITAQVSIALAVIGAVLFSRTFFESLIRLGFGIKNWGILGWIGMLAFAVVAVLCSTQTSLNNDSGLYYIQFMNWINSYPVVPGLANLHDRLGFNSHWHLLNAAYDLKTVGWHATNDLNGLLFLLIGLGSFDSASRTASRKSLYDGIWAVVPLTFFLLLRFLTSTAPDLPSTLIPFVYITYLVEKKREASLPVLAILIAFASTVKVLSVLHVLLLLPLVFWAIKAKKMKTIVAAALLGLVILTPWLGRNVVQTGYLIFPMESIDLIQADWKVPNELATNARKMVDIHARTGTYDLDKYGASTFTWFDFWLSVQSKSVLVLFGFVGFASLLALLGAFKKLSSKKHRDAALISLTLSVMVLLSYAFWWKSGPNPRFIYGIVFFYFAYAVTTLFTSIRLGILLRIVPVLALVPIFMLTRTVLNEEGPKRPTAFDTMEAVETTIYYPATTDKCWAQPLPCANQDRTDIELRGQSLSDGFMNTLGGE